MGLDDGVDKHLKKICDEINIYSQKIEEEAITNNGNLVSDLLHIRGAGATTEAATEKKKLKLRGKPATRAAIKEPPSSPTKYCRR